MRRHLSSARARTELLRSGATGARLRPRATLLLALCVLTTLVVAAPSADAASAQLAVTLFQDLDTRGDTYGPDSPAAIVRSGPNVFFQATDSAGDMELYVSNGEPGSAVKIDVWPGDSSATSSGPTFLTPVGASSILFIARNGTGPWGNDLDRRLFVSDGTLAGTHPVVPTEAGGGDATAGFYEIDAVGSLITDTATKGVVFGAKAYWSGTTQTARVPWRYADDATVSNLTLGFDYGFTSSMVQGMMAAVGDVVYADLPDPSVGRELFRLDLSAGSPSWQLVADQSSGAASTGAFALNDVVGSNLYFGARPSGDTNSSIYRTSGSGVTLVAADPDGDTLSLGIAYAGSWYYFRGNELWREGNGSALATCGNSGSLDAFQGADPFAVLDDVLYLPCGQSSTPAGEFSLIYQGLYSYTPGGGLQVVYDPGPYGVDPYATAFSVGRLIPFGGALYFSANDPASSYQLSEFFTYDGSGDPERFKINPTGSSRVSQAYVAEDRLFVWADDGVHGKEPWSVRIITHALTVAIAGDGSVTSSDDGIDCTVPDGDCSEVYDGGTQVTLSATAGGSSTFEGWSPNCQPATATTCTVDVSRARTVSAFFSSASDSFALAAGGPDTVGAGSLTPFTVTVRNYGGASLTGSHVTVATTLTSATQGCTTVSGGYSCSLPTVPAGDERTFVFYAFAPPYSLSASADATFTLDLTGTGSSDGDTSDNTATVTIPVVVDLLSLKISGFPLQGDSASPLTYNLSLRNGSANTAATGIVLHAGFDSTEVSLLSSTNCTFDVVPAPPALASVSCPLTSVAAGSSAAIAFQIYAPTLTSSDPALDLAATFWVSYTQIVGTDTRNDIDGPVVTSIQPPPVAPAAVSAFSEGPPTLQHAVEAPTTGATDLNTLPEAGLDASDPTATGLTLPSGFVGEVAITEETQTAGVSITSEASLQMRRVLIQAAATPQEFACTATPTYAADCLVFDTSIEPQLQARYVYQFTFRYSRSAFVSSGQALRIRQIVFFHDADGDGTFEERVGSCRGRATATSYSGTGPCLKRVYSDRATGDYVFLIISDTNGSWKAGR